MTDREGQAPLARAGAALADVCERWFPDAFVFALAAAEQAVKDSGWLPTEHEDQIRTGVMVGSGIGGGLVIDNSTISGNRATGTGVGGGVMYFFGTASATPPAGFTASTVVVRNSTISGNQTGNGGSGALSGSRGEGGGIHSGNAALTITGSTITANGASGGGGRRCRSARTPGQGGT